MQVKAMKSEIKFKFHILKMLSQISFICEV